MHSSSFSGPRHYVVGDVWSGLRPGYFTSGTLWVGDWVSPRAGLDVVEKGKCLSIPGLELAPSVVQTVASRYVDYVTPAPALTYQNPTFYLQNVFVLWLSEYRANCPSKQNYLRCYA